MPGIYARWIDNWERKLATRDTNRVVRPFEWGLDWLGRLDFPALPDYGNGHPREALDRFAQEALTDSDRFFSYRVPSDYQLREGHLTFTSPTFQRSPITGTAIRAKRSTASPKRR